LQLACDVLHPIIQEKSELFSEKNPSDELDDTGKWEAGGGGRIAFPASWTLLE
jgi:hypothetical protein